MSSSSGEQLFYELDEILKKNQDLDEYDIVFLEECKKFYLVNSKLAIDAKVAKLLATWLNSEVVKLRIDSALKDEGYVESVTRCVLLFITDHATAWNMRKELVCEGHLKVDDDLKFNAVILGKNPKSSEVFFHRKWLLERQTDSSSKLQHSVDPDLLTNEELKREMEICRTCSEKRSNNQPAWKYRFWLMNLSFSNQIIESEMAATRTYIGTHVSDYMAFNHRQNIILFVLCSCAEKNDHNNFISMLVEEADMLDELLAFYKEFESLWYHKRFIVLMMMEISFCNTTLSNIARKFSELAREFTDHSKASKRHNHFHHKHYHHRFHHHYKHHHHHHHSPCIESSSTDPGQAANDGNGQFDGDLKLSTDLKSTLLNSLDKSVDNEINVFRNLNVKYRQSYVENSKMLWSDFVARRYVSWFRRTLSWLTSE